MKRPWTLPCLLFLLFLLGLALGYALHTHRPADRFQPVAESNTFIDRQTGLACKGYPDPESKMPSCLDLYHKY